MLTAVRAAKADVHAAAFNHKAPSAVKSAGIADGFRLDRSPCASDSASGLPRKPPNTPGVHPSHEKPILTITLVSRACCSRFAVRGIGAATQAEQTSLRFPGALCARDYY